MDYTMENTLNYTAARRIAEKYGARVSYLADNLYVEYPGHATRKIEPVYIQNDGWRYPIAELAPPSGWSPDGMMTAYQLNDEDRDWMGYEFTFRERHYTITGRITSGYHNPRGAKWLAENRDNAAAWRIFFSDELQVIDKPGLR